MVATQTQQERTRDAKIEISVIVPAYNEEQSITGVLEGLKKTIATTKLTFEIIVVDDGSTDSTAKVTRSIKGITLIQHPFNRGYGAALKTGIQRARGEYIIITDADGTYPNEEIPKLLNYIQQYDMVVGARIGERVKMPISRKIAKFFIVKLSNYLVKSKIPDLNSGLRIFKKDTAMKFFNILPARFSFTTTITLAYLCNDYLIKYVPINYNPRKGESKIRSSDTLNFTSLVIRTMTFFKPFRVFFPISLLLMFLALLVFFYTWIFMGKVMDITIIVLIIASIQIGLFGLLADLIVRRSEYK